MFWIGVTGGIGSGKSTFARFLESFGVPVVSADDLARQAVGPGGKGLEELKQAFGVEILLPTGELDRSRLATLIFKSPSLKDQVEKILHPIIRNLQKQKRESLRLAGHQIAAYDVPLLFEAGLEDDFDLIIVVSCTLEQQKERMRQRNNWSDIEIEQRLNAQIPLAEKVKKPNVKVISNLGSLEELKGLAQMMLNDIRSRIGSSPRP